MSESKGYRERYDDKGLVETVTDAKKLGLTAREFTEMIYIPTFMLEDFDVFFDFLVEDEGKFIYDIYSRAWSVYDESIPFEENQFAAEMYGFGDDVRIIYITLPQNEAEEESFLHIAIVLDMKEEQIHFLAVERGDGENHPVSSLDLDCSEWCREGVFAPRDTEEFLQFAIDVTVNKEQVSYHYVSKSCPLCGSAFSLGLTDTESEIYNKVLQGDVDLEEALPALNSFEKEFLITGMCLDCQKTVFKKNLPADLSRWKLG